MQCSSCNTTVLESDRFCEECGTQLIASTADKACIKCGETNLDAEGFCLQCGFRQEARKRVEIVCSTEFAGISDRGLRHPHNEDAIALHWIDQTAILVVCDGVSSSHNADQAAQLAAKTVCDQLSKIGSTPAEIALKSAIESAQLAVSQLADPTDSEPPSTTIVAAVVQNRTATIAALGDSRAYWISPSLSKQLTEDDSWLNQVVQSGEMSQLEAQNSPNAHAITRWLGADAIDEVNPTIVTFPIPDSGHLLLCTDGLWNYTPNVQQLSALVRPADSITIAQSLVDYALSHGGHDNITVAVLSI